MFMDMRIECQRWKLQRVPMEGDRDKASTPTIMLETINPYKWILLS